MATGMMKSEEWPVFKQKLMECESDRYELWVTDKMMGLVPVVTSKNVHTYFISIEGRKPEEIDEAMKLFKGRIIKMMEIMIDKW